MALNEYDEMLSGSEPATANEYDSLAVDKSAQAQTIKQNVFVNKDVEPARKVQVIKTANKANLPTAFVDKNLDKIQKKMDLNMDYDSLIDESPGVAQWMQDPDNVGLGKNDINGLKKIDQSVQRFKPYKPDPVTIHKEYFNAAKGGLNQLGSSAYLLGAAYGKIDVKDAAEAIAGFNKKHSEMSEMSPTYVKNYQEILKKESGDIDKGVDKFLSGANEYRKGNVVESLKRFLKGGGATVGETVDLVYESLINNPRAVGYMAVESLSNSFPSLLSGAAGGFAGGAVGSAVPVIGNVTGGVAGFAGGTFLGSAGVEIGSSILQELSERKVDLNSPDAIAAALNDPALMADVRSRAERKGLTTAAIDGLFSVFAGGLSKGARGIGSKVVRGAGDVGVQAVGETVSEFGGQVAKEKGDLSKVSFGDAVSEGIISLGHSIGETTIATSSEAVKQYRNQKYTADTVKATEQVVEDTAKSFKTLTDLESIQKASEEISNLKDVKEVPEKIKELIDYATGGDEGAAVYFQADDWDNYWNKKGKSPATMASEILGDNGKSYHESKETGASIEVPVGQFISKTALNEDSKDLLNITRTSVDGPTLSEAQEQLQALPGVMEELAREATGVTEVPVDDVSMESEAKTIGQDITEQLKNTGITDQEARTYSKIYEAAFNSLGQRFNVSPREIFDRYNLKINKAETTQAVEGEQSFNQDAPNQNRQSPLGFYSQLESEISKMDFKQIPAKDLANRIKNIQGLKQEEIEFIGINEFLNAKDGKVTKEEVIEFVKNNGVKVEQIVLGGQSGEGSGPFDWTEPKFVKLSEHHSNRYWDAVNDEVENSISGDKQYYEEQSAEMRNKIVDEFTDEAGEIDEDALSTAVEERLREQFEENAKEYVDSQDYYDAVYIIEERNSGYELQGNDERGWYSPEAREWFEGNEEEAKIKLANYLRAHEGVEFYSSDLIHAGEIRWGGATAAKTPSQASITKRANALIKSDLKRLQTKAKEENHWNYSEDVSAAKQKKNLKEDVARVARQEAREYYNDPENPKNTVEVSIGNEVIDSKIVGNNKKGWKLTYPVKGFADSEFDLKAKTIEDAKTEAVDLLVEKEVISPAPKADANDINKPQGKSKWGKYTVEGEKENYREVLLTLPNLGPEKFTYRTHFDQENILAHVRLSDRVDAKGRKTLFIEEIQSDLHQQGREKGYKKPEDIKRRQEVTEAIDANDKAIDELSTSVPADEWKAKVAELKAKGDTLMKELDALDTKLEGVPDAPFKNTDSWAALAMKRMIRLAVEQGYEAVAWTPAEVHVDRWGTDSVSWVKRPGGFTVKGLSANSASDPIYATREEAEQRAKFYNDKANKDAGQKADYTVEEIGPHFLVGSAEQRGGNADGVNIEQLARQRGQLLERNGERVSNREELMAVMADTLNRERTDRSLDSLTERVWKQMQAEDQHTGAIRPRAEGMEFFYNKMIPDVTKKLLKKLDPEAKIEITKINEGETVFNESEDREVPSDGMNVLSVPITDGLKAKVQEGFTLFQDETKGQIRFGKDGINIDLLKNADPSTFIHETGHFFLEVFGDLAEADSAPQQIKDDWQTVLDWFGATSRADIKVEHHEQWARGFEAYLMEGKAPSSRLRKSFHRFKIWLTSVYRQLRNLNVEMSDEVKNVMGRLLATEAEIQEARTDYNLEPMFSDPTTFGMTGKKAERYLQAREEAQIAAEEQMLAKVMAGYTREKHKWWKDRRKTVVLEVSATVDEMPVYKALALLQRGTKPDGSPLGEGTQAVKLDRQSLVDQYGAEFVKNRLPKPFIYAREGGIHPDVFASSMGFESGDEMITQMVNMPPRKEFIDKLADQKMHADYPDLLASDEDLEAAALESIHNDKRAQLLRLELEHLLSNDLPVAKDVIRKTVRRMPPENFMKEQASKIISRTVVNKIRPHLFLAAEKRASKEAAQALTAGDFDKAYTAKEKELINHELYKASLEAKEKISNDLDKFKKLFRKDEDLAKSRDLNLVNAARSILAQFGLGKTAKAASEYLEDMRRYDPDSYETMKALVDSATEGAGFYKEVTLNDFEEMSVAVLALWGMSKRSQEILIEGKKLDRRLVIDELSAQVDVISQTKEKPGYTKAVSQWDKFQAGLAGAASILRRVEQWSDAMDLGSPSGAFKKYIFNPVSEGATQYRVAKKATIEKYLEIVKGVEKSITRDPIKSPELNYEFKGKQELIGALLHTGNESNLKKLLVGRGWGSYNSDESLNSAKWDGFIDRLHREGVLTKTDWDFVQNVWDLMESLKPEAQRAHFEMYGYYFNEITAQEIETPFGAYRGGYMPAIADTFMAADAQIRADKELLEKSNNSFMFPTTGRGFTKSRVEQYAAPLIIDLSLVPRHIDKVLRFVHIEPRVKDVARLIIDRGFRQKLDGFDNTIAGEMLNPWLQRAAQQAVEIPSQGRGAQFIDQAFKKIRSNTGLNIMTANVVNTLQQVTGLSVGALEVKPKFLRNSLWSYVRSPKKYAEMVASKSDFMATRTTTSVIEVQNTIDEMLLNPSKYEKLREFARKHGYFLQSSAQNIVDVIVWGGAYDQAVGTGVSEAEAIRASDRAVRATQGSFNAEDMSKFEIGSPMFRAFTMFYSYFNMLANVNATKFQTTVRELGLKKGAGRLLYIYTFGLMIPAVLSELITKAGAGDFDEDDDDQYMDDFLSLFFGSQFRMITAMTPYVGQVTNTALNMWNDKPYDDKISISPAIGTLESALKSPVSIYKVIDGDGNKKKAVRDTLTAIGLLTGVPVQPLAKPIGYLIDVEEGNADPSGILDFTRGLVTGRPGAN